jgi:protein dithiol oxidoreductase (disulfide-forming)
MNRSLRLGYRCWVGFVLWGLWAVAQANTFQQDKHYKLIDPPQTTADSSEVEVIELFWYGCPHCYRFDPYIKAWLKKPVKGMTFRHFPAIFSKRWVSHARVFYTAEALGLSKVVHQPFFEAIHKDRKAMTSDSELITFFTQHGVSEKDFLETFRSFGVESKVQRARMMTKRYQSSGVPAMVVDGRYRTDGGMAGGYNEMLEVVEFLVDKVREERVSSTQE